MNTNHLPPDCQLKDVHNIANGPQDAVPFRKALRLSVRRMLGPRNMRKIKLFANDVLNWLAKFRGRPTKPAHRVTDGIGLIFKTGDRVRVRSLDEIEATLDYWRQLKGCSFAAEMMQYCSTTQIVLKPVERFVDERDLRVRRTKGIVLLEGIVCQGTASLGDCDRSCLYFWRVEWLEKIE